VKLSLAALAVLVVIAPAAARAETGFETFKAVCLDTAGSKAGVLAAADSRKWSAIPREKLATFPTFVGQPSDVDGWVDGDLNSPASIKAAVVVGHAAKIAEGFPFGADFCATIVQGDAQSVKTDASTYAAVPETSGLVPGATAYAWRDGRGGRKALSSDELQTSSAEGAKVLFTQGLGPFVAIGMIATTKMSPN